MAGKKRFNSSLFGFKKSDVNEYIEKMLEEFVQKVNGKDKELLDTKNQLDEVSSKYEEISKMADEIKQDKDKIAGIFEKAQGQADMIIQDAKIQAIEEKKDIEALIEKEKEKLVDLKREIKDLKEDVSIVLKGYQTQLDNMIGPDLDSDEEFKVFDEEPEDEPESNEAYNEDEDIFRIYRENDGDEIDDTENIDEKSFQEDNEDHDENEEPKNIVEVMNEIQMEDETKGNEKQEGDALEVKKEEDKKEEDQKKEDSETDKYDKPDEMKEIDEIDEIDKIDELKEILEFYTSEEKDYHIK
jgi:cell division initiation protein